MNLFPDARIFVLITEIEHEKRIASLGARAHLINNKYGSLVEQKQFDERFRDGFWKASIMRLFAVLDFSLELNLGSILHIENDVALFENFPLDAIAKQKKTMWMKFNDSQDVAALMWLPTPQVAQEVLEALVRAVKANPHHTDMTALSDVAKKIRDFEYFPSSLSIEKREQGKEKSNISGLSEEAAFKKFGGIFDGAVIGMWLAGQDPRNYKGRVIYHRVLKESPARPNLLKFTLSNNASSPALFANGFPLYCLHIHSKNPKAFKLRSKDYYSKLVEKSHTKNEIIEFSISAFIRVLVEGYRQHRGAGNFEKFKKMYKFLTGLP